MTIKADEVYKILREATGPWFKLQGFKRTAERMLGWYQPIDGEYLIVSFYCWPRGSDALAGSKFTVEVELSDKPKMFNAAPGEKRKRLVEFFDDQQRARVLEIQNSVIAKLEKPGKDHFIYGLPQTVIDSYLWEFQPLTHDNALWYREWFRYRDAGDVRLWTQFVLDVLPGVLASFEPRFKINER